MAGFLFGGILCFYQAFGQPCYELMMSLTGNGASLGAERGC